MRAIRGAITIGENSRDAIAAAVKELVEAIARENQIVPADIISAIFTLTPDLNADFPARAARECGWQNVPMICATEIPVPGALPKVCRLILHARGRKASKHVYLRDAKVLRPDLHE